jgi:GAF domain-containing protein
VLEGGGLVRADDGAGAAIGVPVSVEGALWGVLCAAGSDATPLRDDTEESVRAFTDLIAIAVSIADTRRHRGQLADELVALRRVATLVAGGASITEVFGAVAEELVQVLGVRSISLDRFDAGAMSTVVSDPVSSNGTAARSDARGGAGEVAEATRSSP